MTAATPQQPGRDLDSQETREWMDALSAVIDKEGPERAHFLLEQLLEEARQQRVRGRKVAEQSGSFKETLRRMKEWIVGNF